MVCNTVLTSANAAFLGWLDLYAVALLLAVLGVRLIDKDKIWQIILGILCIALSLGTYQSYLFVAVGLMMFIIIRELYSNSEIKKTLLKALRYVASLLIGGGIYYLCRGTCPDVKEYTIELIGENAIDSKLSQAFPKENNVPTIIDAGFINIIPTLF